MTIRVSSTRQPELSKLFVSYSPSLAELFNVSNVEVLLADAGVAGSEPVIEVRHSAHAKCERCWRYYVPDVAEDPRFPTVCLPCCAEALEAIGFPP